MFCRLTLMSVYILILSNTMCNALTGVNFISQNEFYSTYSTWALSFSVDLNTYYKQIDKINDTLSDLTIDIFDKLEYEQDKISTLRKNMIRSVSRTPDNIQELRASNTAYFNVLNDLHLLMNVLGRQLNMCKAQTDQTIFQLIGILDNIKSMYTFVPPSRVARSSLLPWGGDLLSSIFGVATKSNLNALRKQLGNIAINQNEVVHIVENSLSMINKTNAHVSQNRKATNRLIKEISMFNIQLSIINTTLLNNNLLNRLSRNLQVQISTVTKAVTMALQNVKISINTLNSDVNQALLGSLSTSLIEPPQLMSILDDISKQLPVSLQLKNFNNHHIMWYYKHLPVTVVPDDDKMHFVSIIPLIPLESLYTLYRVIVLPIPIPDTNRNSQIIVEGTHFAVSKKGDTFVILDEDELTKCAANEMTYCALHRAAMKLSKVQSCLASLYLNNENGIQNNCPVKVSDNHQFPVFQHLVEGKWMIATREDILLHTRCNNDNDFLFPTIIKPPLQVVSLNSSCTGYTKFAILPPYFYQTSSTKVESVLEKINIGLDMAHIYNVNSTNYTFDFQLRNSNSRDNLLPEVEQLDISNMQHKLQHLSKNELEINDNGNTVLILGSLIGGALFVLLVGVGVFLYCKLTSRKKSKLMVKYNKKDSIVEVEPDLASASVDRCESVNGNPTLPDDPLEPHALELDQDQLTAVLSAH